MCKIFIYIAKIFVYPINRLIYGTEKAFSDKL